MWGLRVHGTRLRGSRISNWADLQNPTIKTGAGAVSSNAQTPKQSYKTHEESGNVTLPKAKHKPKKMKIYQLPNCSK